jgi:hypothetical protein
VVGSFPFFLVEVAVSEVGKLEWVGMSTAWRRLRGLNRKGVEVDRREREEGYFRA